MMRIQSPDEINSIGPHRGLHSCRKQPNDRARISHHWHRRPPPRLLRRLSHSASSSDANLPRRRLRAAHARVVRCAMRRTQLQHRRRQSGARVLLRQRLADKRGARGFIGVQSDVHRRRRRDVRWKCAPLGVSRATSARTAAVPRFAL